MEEKETEQGKVIISQPDYNAPVTAESLLDFQKWPQASLEKVPEPETAPEQSTPLPSLKAGVTTGTFWPTQPSQEFLDGKLTVGRVVPAPGRTISQEFKAVSHDTPRTTISLTGAVEIERRIKKLEEQVDALLERIANYNFKAQHKI